MRLLHLLKILCLIAAVVACTPWNRPSAPVHAQSGGSSSSGWHLPRLAEAFQLAQTMGSTTLMVVTEAHVIQSLGKIDVPYRVHSVRKAVLSALVGQHIGNGPGRINLDDTLEDLGIDDAPVPLTPLQKQATVEHLIRSVSGINHDAAAETGAMSDDRRRRLGQSPIQPGTVWAYNNWDYNTLTTIFERETGLSVEAAFLDGIARPLGMQDVDERTVFYVRKPSVSRHPKAGFRLSARDMARFGQLYLNNGWWKGRQIIPATWVNRVVTHSTRTGKTGLGSGHGYLWWVPCDAVSRRAGIPAGTYLASGFAGQRIVVIPAWKTVIVHQVRTDDYPGFCRNWMRARQFDETMAIAYSRGACREAFHSSEPFCMRCRYYSGDDFMRLLEAICHARIQLER